MLKCCIYDLYTLALNLFCLLSSFCYITHVNPRPSFQENPCPTTVYPPTDDCCGDLGVCGGPNGTCDMDTTCCPAGCCPEPNWLVLVYYDVCLNLFVCLFVGTHAARAVLTLQWTINTVYQTVLNLNRWWNTIYVMDDVPEGSKYLDEWMHERVDFVTHCHCWMFMFGTRDARGRIKILRGGAEQQSNLGRFGVGRCGMGQSRKFSSPGRSGARIPVWCSLVIQLLNALGSAVQTGSVLPQLPIAQLQVIFKNNFFLLCLGNLSKTF